MQDTCAIIAAGGLGTRFGDARGKQYVEACGRRIIDWALAAFDKAPSVGHIVVVCPQGRVRQTQEGVLGRLGKPVTFVEGGPTRQDSCLAGLGAVPEGFALVAIHDAARPLVRPADIEAVIARVRDDEGLDGALCACPVVDTLKVVGPDMIVRSTPERALCWAAQTPQVFRTPAVIDAHLKAREEGFVGTDDASLVERMGGRVACVETSQTNFKVTVPQDLARAEAELARRASQPQG